MSFSASLGPVELQIGEGIEEVIEVCANTPYCLKQIDHRTGKFYELPPLVQNLVKSLLRVAYPFSLKILVDVFERPTVFHIEWRLNHSPPFLGERGAHDTDQKRRESSD